MQSINATHKEKKESIYRNDLISLAEYVCNVCVRARSQTQKICLVIFMMYSTVFSRCHDISRNKDLVFVYDYDLSADRRDMI